MFAFLSLRRSAAAFFICLLVFSSHGVHADDCVRTTRVKSLFLAETADIQDRGRTEFSMTGGQGSGVTDYHYFDIRGELGIAEGWQFQGDLSQRRLPAGGVDHALTAGVGHRLLCEEGLPTLRLNVGFHHNGGNGPIAGIVAGQEIGFVSWQAQITRNAAVYTTHYSGALLFDDLIFPLVLEAMADRTRNGWNRWGGGALYLLSSRHFDLGVSYARGDGISDGERLVMVRMTMAF